MGFQKHYVPGKKLWILWSVLCALAITTAQATEPEIEFTFLNVAHLNLNHPMHRVNHALAVTLRDMGFKTVEQVELIDGRKIEAETERLEMEAKLHRVTGKITEIRVDVKEKGYINQRDKETAREIIRQSLNRLEGRKTQPPTVSEPGN